MRWRASSIVQPEDGEQVAYIRKVRHGDFAHGVLVRVSLYQEGLQALIVHLQKWYRWLWNIRCTFLWWIPFFKSCWSFDCIVIRDIICFPPCIRIRRWNLHSLFLDSCFNQQLLHFPDIGDPMRKVGYGWIFTNFSAFERFEPRRRSTFRTNTSSHSIPFQSWMAASVMRSTILSTLFPSGKCSSHPLS